MSAKYKSPSFLLPNELNTSANTANDTGINSLYSMDFDGTEYITGGLLSEYISLSAPTSFTVSAWIKTTDNSGSRKGVVSSAYYSNGLNFYILQGEVSFGVGNAPALATTTTANVNDGNWHHVVGTYDSQGDASGNTLYIYVDRIPKASNTGIRNPSIAFDNYPLFIGANGAGSSTYFPFIGKIDEVAIFNRALNSTEIAALYGGTSPNIYPSNLMATDLNPIAYYPLGEQAQNTGYLDPNNPGSDISGSEWQFPNGVLQDYVMDFDGSDNINSEANISSASSFTASVWINRDDSNTQYIYGQWVDGTSASQSWVIQTVGGIVYFNVRDASLATKSAISTASLTTGVWYNIIAVWTGSNIKLYINNSLEDTTACTSMNNPSTAVKLAIGSSSNNVSPFNGKISNAVIWNSDQESNRANIYNNGSPQTSYTVAPQNWWKLNADSVYTPSAPNYTTALDFVASESDYIDAGNPTDLQITGALTISCWFKTTDTNYQFLVTKDDGTNSCFGVGLRQQKIYATIFSSGLTDIETTTTWTDGNWHNVVFVFTPSTSMEIFVDGNSEIRETTGIPSSIDNDPANLNIGRRGNNTRYYTGQLSNAAIFNSALTASQVSTLFNFGTPETNISFSPQAWWKLDDQTAITDYSGNGNTGTNNGATDATTSVAVVPSWKIPSALPITTTPNYTTALNFDSASSDYIDCGNVPELNGVTQMSFSIWFNNQTPSNSKGLIGDMQAVNFSPTIGRFHLIVRNVSGNDYSFRLYIIGSDSAAHSIDIDNRLFTSNEWYNLVVVYNAGLVNFYVDGSLASSTITAGAPIPTSFGTLTYPPNKPLQIGRWSSLYWDGKISNASIWDTSLTSAQITEIYNNGTPSNLSSHSASSNLVSWWKLDTGGSTITDSAGSNNGTNSNPGATQVTSDVLTTQPVNGVSTTLPSTALQQSDLQFDSPYSNYSLSFDGATYVNCGDSDIFSFGDGTSDSPFSLSAWVYITGTTSQGIVTKYAASASLREWLFYTTGGQIRLLLYDGSTNTMATSATTLSINTWYHVVCTYDGRGGSTANQGINLYIDGTQESVTLAGGNYSYMTNTTQPVEIGRHSGSSYLNGNIDETAIFNTELTSAQVLEIYNNGRPKDLTTFSGTAPISWWRLGENAYFQDSTLVLPNSITGAPNGNAATNNLEMISADAPGTYANGIGTNLDILDRVGDAALSTSNSQSYNMIPSDISPYVPQYVGKQIANNFSMSFSGVLDYISLGNPNNLQITGAISLSFWFNSTASTSGFITKSDNGSYFSSNSSKVYEIGILSNQLYWQIGDGTNVSSLPLAFSSYLDGNWHHVVATWDGTTNASSQMLFVDGLQVGSRQSTISAIQNKSNNVIISSQSSSYDYVGKLDEVAIFDTALNAGQIYNDIYQPTATGTNQTADFVNNPNLPNPVAWYRMGD